MFLLSVEILKNLLCEILKNGLGIVVIELENFVGFGCIVCNDMGYIVVIVEYKDVSENILKIREINMGILTALVKLFKKWLPKFKNKNK